MKKEQLQLIKNEISLHSVNLSELQRPEKSDSTAAGITIINDSSFTVSVLVANQILGIASSGYIKPNQRLVLPAGWAWWDVYVLFQNINAHLFLNGNSVYAHKKQSNVGYRATLKVSEI